MLHQIQLRAERSSVALLSHTLFVNYCFKEKLSIKIKYQRKEEYCPALKLDFHTIAYQTGQGSIIIVPSTAKWITWRNGEKISNKFIQHDEQNHRFGRNFTNQTFFNKIKYHFFSKSLFSRWMSSIYHHPDQGYVKYHLLSSIAMRFSSVLTMHGFYDLITVSFSVSNWCLISLF